MQECKSLVQGTPRHWRQHMQLIPANRPGRAGYRCQGVAGLPRRIPRNCDNYGYYELPLMVPYFASIAPTALKQNLPYQLLGRLCDMQFTSQDLLRMNLLGVYEQQGISAPFIRQCYLPPDNVLDLAPMDPQGLINTGVLSDYSWTKYWDFKYYYRPYNQPSESSSIPPESSSVQPSEFPTPSPPVPPPDIGGDNPPPPPPPPPSDLPSEIPSSFPPDSMPPSGETCEPGQDCQWTYINYSYGVQCFYEPDLDGVLRNVCSQNKFVTLVRNERTGDVLYTYSGSLPAGYLQDGRVKLINPVWVPYGEMVPIPAGSLNRTKFVSVSPVYGNDEALTTMQLHNYPEVEQTRQRAVVCGCYKWAVIMECSETLDSSSGWEPSNCPTSEEAVKAKIKVTKLYYNSYLPVDYENRQYTAGEVPLTYDTPHVSSDGTTRTRYAKAVDKLWDSEADANQYHADLMAKFWEYTARLYLDFSGCWSYDIVADCRYNERKESNCPGSVSGFLSKVVVLGTFAGKYWDNGWRSYDTMYCDPSCPTDCTEPTTTTP